MTTPSEEAALETSIYHYFLFKANQAATAAAREAAQRNSNVTPLAVLATAANDKDSTEKLPAKPDSNEKDTGKSSAQGAIQKKLPLEESKDDEDGTKKSTDKPSETTKNPASMPAAKTTAGRKLPSSGSGTESLAAVMSGKYNRVVAAMRQDFPQYAQNVPKNAAWVAPDIILRYGHYPQLHNEVGFLRQRVFMLEQQLQQQQGQNHQMFQSIEHMKQQPRKRGRPPKNPPTEEDPSGPTKKTRILSRKDVPDDVKELLAQQRKESNNEKRNMKKKIARLEKKVNETKEKLNTIAKTPPQPLPSKQASPPPPPQPVAAVAAATTAAVSPPKPKAPEKPVGPPPCFESRFKELVDFQRANNHCRVPTRMPGLGRWVTDLRRNYKMAQERPETLEAVPLNMGDLTQERIDRLNALNFDWDVAPKMVPWQERFEQVVAYKEKYSDTLIPRNWKENPPLGEWVHMQRKLYKSNAKVIQGERTDKLNSIGFAWSTGTRQKVPWEDRLEQCRDYRRKHGHLKVPPPPNPNREGEKELAESQTPEERSFQWWCHRQRENYRKMQVGKKTSMDKKRVKQLEELGFDWMANHYGKSGASKLTPGKPKNEDVYNEQVEKLRRVKELYGDCNDLKNVEKVFPGDKKLNHWIKNQRKQYRNWQRGEWTSLTTDRRLLLESLDFNFEPRKHYAPYGSKKKEDASEQDARAAALRAAAQAAEELEEHDDDDDDSNENSTMQDYQYIQGGSVRL